MALLGYPEWAMMKNRQGEDVPKPWVTGASPVSQALLATGLGILADRPDDSGWVQEGGIDLSGIGRGGLLGLQQYVDATRNLHDFPEGFLQQACRYTESTTCKQEVPGGTETDQNCRAGEAADD